MSRPDVTRFPTLLIISQGSCLFADPSLVNKSYELPIDLSK